MANRAYLYSLSHVPSAYVDRPEAITGLSEWPYAVPFAYRVLLSAEPKLCPSLLADGLDSDEPGHATPLWAIAAPFEPGMARLEKLLAAVSVLAAGEPPSAPAPRTLWQRLRGIAPPPPAALRPPSPALQEAIDDTRRYLHAHRDAFVLLETVELDLMSEDSADGLRAAAEHERQLCVAAGAAIDALPNDPGQAALELLRACAGRAAPPLDALHGLQPDDAFDTTRDGSTEYPLGLSYWNDILYFAPANRADFQSSRQDG